MILSSASPMPARISPKPADRVLQPHPATAWKRLGAATVGLHLAARVGKQAKSKAVVAVARKLAVLLHHLWSTQEPSLHAVLRTSGLKMILFTRCDDTVFQ